MNFDISIIEEDLGYCFRNSSIDLIIHVSYSTLAASDLSVTNCHFAFALVNFFPGTHQLSSESLILINEKCSAFNAVIVRIIVSNLKAI
jgi:hypothetical protein